MQIERHRHYDKAWVKLTLGQQTKALQAIGLFLSTPNHPKLRLHQLKGKYYYPQYSISAGGDLRIHLSIISDEAIKLMAIGRHTQLYE
jgi:mRNA-degrading endonuclease YafQ of YafQ-DinJ toxin-antitoxin module